MENQLDRNGWVYDPSEGFIAHLGGLWIRNRDTEPEFALCLDERHGNRNGVAHGGALMTFVDRAFGMTARLRSGAPRGATISLSHNFVAPVQIGCIAMVKPKIVKLTTRLAFVEGVMTVEDVPVLQAQGVWRLASIPPAG